MSILEIGLIKFMLFVIKLVLICLIECPCSLQMFYIDGWMPSKQCRPASGIVNRDVGRCFIGMSLTIQHQATIYILETTEGDGSEAEVMVMHGHCCQGLIEPLF